MRTDFHSHVLPGMDDGAATPEMSVSMLRTLYAQGVSCVMATPHFFLHLEKPEHFALRRTEALNALREKMTGEALPDIIPGAEVRLERGLYERKDLDFLCMGSSRYILVELPFSDYREWLAEELYNLVRESGKIPIIAHINRYLALFSPSEMSRILSLQDVLFQINLEALESRSSRRWAFDLAQEGFPLVWGSDTHNLDFRRPNFDLWPRVIEKKLPPETIEMMAAGEEKVTEAIWAAAQKAD